MGRTAKGSMPGRREAPVRQQGIERIAYRPAAPGAFDVEIFSMRSLKARVPAQDLRSPHRLEFHQLMCVTQGECTHVMDFSPVRCKPGSLLVFHPSQTEQYDVASHWDGWLVLFRPELLFAPTSAPAGTAEQLNLVSLLAGLAPHVDLTGSAYRQVRRLMAQMHADSSLEAPKPEIGALLRHQLCALLIRIQIAQRERDPQRPHRESDLLRFRRFHQMVEQSFRHWHGLATYADALGCTERTLTRATTAVTGISAKAFLASRIALEAKRLLVHTSTPVALVADQLGFADASNFVKFFRRDAGCTPTEFRGGFRAGV